MKAIPLDDVGPFLQHNSQVAAYRRNRNHRVYRAVKRIFDVIVSGLVLLLLLPLFVILAAAIALTSRGPILYRHRRMGLNGSTFQCLKFRTMIADADLVLSKRRELQAQFEQNFKIKDDPRVTRLGKFLRKTSIDELPQFINVLTGSMSLVGPRPIVARELERYGDSVDVLLSVKPGLAGLWQASGRSNTTYEERVALDLEYVHRCGLLFDAMLILRTSVAIVRLEGAC